MPLEDQFRSLFNALKKYWLFYYNNFDKLNIESYNYFIPKLWVCTLLPYTTLGILAFIFRAPLADFRPFKKAESIHGTASWATQKQIKKNGSTL